MRAVSLAFLATVAQARPTLDEYKANKEQEAADAEEARKNEAKMAAVNKVITMLEDLQAQVLAEGEKEAASYNEFACFCKDTTQEKSEAITKGTDDKEALTTTINDLSEKRDELDDKIAELEGDIEEAQSELDKATKERHETLQVYEKNAADLEGALAALDGAIDALKASKNPSFIEINRVAKTVQTAAVLADALGLGNAAHVQRTLGFFLQEKQPEVEMEDYKFHSQDVIETLEQLKKEFRATKNEVDADEVKSVAEYDALKQEKLDFIKAKNSELDQAKKDKDKTTAEISMNSEELTTTAADLLDDQQYLKELAEVCEAKAKTWDQRSRVRADELSALTAATAVIKERVADSTSKSTVRFAQMGTRVSIVDKMAHNAQALEAIELEAEAADAPASFLQKRSARNFLSTVLAKRHDPQSDDGRQIIVSLLKSEGARIKSTLLTSLASQIQADPFAKIKKLIQELIEKLLQEAADEANQKGWCDKAQADAKQKRDYSSESIAELNAQMAELEALRNKLHEEIEVLQKEIAELEQAQDEATKLREQEHAENEATVVEAEAGLEAVNEAIDILDKFYKTAAKEKVDLGLVQKGPLDDMPDAGFDAGEEYTGAGGESGGILGMLDVIKSDFERTIKVTKKNEKTNEDEYQKFMTESGVSLVEKKMAEEQKTKQRDQAIEELESADEDLHSQTEILKVSLKELIELKPQCVDTGMSYEERVARREDEIEGLKKALCVLEHMADEDPNAAC
jgi:chromosome segregation ATPase